MFINDDVKEMMTDLEEMETAATSARSLVREFRAVLSQPAFANVENLDHLRKQFNSSSSDSFGVVRNNRDVLVALIDRAREENQTVDQFQDTLFHLFQLTEMQVIFVRGAKEFFQSPVVTEVAQMMNNTVVSEMNNILVYKNDNENDEAGS